MFQVRDWVRRKPEWQDKLSWGYFVKPENRNLPLLVIDIIPPNTFHFQIPKELENIFSRDDVFEQQYFEKIVITNLKDYA